MKRISLSMVEKCTCRMLFHNYIAHNSSVLLHGLISLANSSIVCSYRAFDEVRRLGCEFMSTMNEVLVVMYIYIKAGSFQYDRWVRSRLGEEGESISMIIRGYILHIQDEEATFHAEGECEGEKVGGWEGEKDAIELQLATRLS